VQLAANVSPASGWNPRLPGVRQPELHSRFVRSESNSEPLPKRDEDIAFASVAQLSRWIEKRQLSSERLTEFISSVEAL